MKQVFSVLLLVMLCLGTLTIVIKIQPAKAETATPLVVTVTPLYAVLSLGQSELFNSSVTGGIPPYTYQWYNDMGGKIPGATNPTYNFTASLPTGPPLLILLSVTDSAGDNAYQTVWAWEPTYDSPVYYTVEPVPVAPLTNVNASVNGLETPSLPSPVGENFTVEIHLRNATVTNVPAGVEGVEVHFYFGNILNYCKPVAFVDELGQPSGALVGPLIYTFEGFYDDNYNPIAAQPYTNATQYMVAGASTTGTGWNGADGLVAEITFQITGQPSSSQPDLYTQLQIGFGDLDDINNNEVALSVAQGTLRIDSASTSSLVGDLNGDGKVNLQDLMLLAQAYGSKPGDPNWNPLADIAPPYGKISLTDLVTLAIHYGQHSP